MSNVLAWGNVVEYNNDMYILNKSILKGEDYLNLVCLRSGISWDEPYHIDGLPTTDHLWVLFNTDDIHVWNGVMDMTTLCNEEVDTDAGC